jgi:hypothetical protein
VAYDLLSVHPARPGKLEADNALIVVRARVLQLLSKLSDRPVFPSGMPALPLCIVVSAVRRVFIALSDIDASLLTLGASIGALVAVAWISWQQFSRIFPEDANRRTEKPMSKCAILSRRPITR